MKYVSSLALLEHLQSDERADIELNKESRLFLIGDERRIFRTWLENVASAMGVRLRKSSPRSKIDGDENNAKAAGGVDMEDEESDRTADVSCQIAPYLHVRTHLTVALFPVCLHVLCTQSRNQLALRATLPLLVVRSKRSQPPRQNMHDCNVRRREAA